MSRSAGTDGVAAIDAALAAWTTRSSDGTVVPFRLGSDEGVWIRITPCRTGSTGAEGAGPAGMSYARIPDVFGPFQTGP